MSACRTLLLVTLSIAACGGGDDGVPAAPSNLAVSELSGGAHLTWQDNSDNETQFMIMRKEMGSTADYTTAASPTFNTTQYHDAPLVSGKTYMYMVMAMNDAGESEPSNDVMITMP